MSFQLQRSSVALGVSNGTSERMWVQLGLVRKWQSEREEKAPREGLAGTLSQVAISPLCLEDVPGWLCFGPVQAELS